MTRAALAVALSLLCAPLARAACSTSACPDVTSVEAVRSLVAASCDCASAKSHGAYVKCAHDIIKAAVRDHRLTKACKQASTHCEAKSSCGRQHTAICCTAKRGKVKARMIRTSAVARCGGTTCDGQMALVDACTADGGCATPRRGIRSFRSVQQVLTTSCALASCHSTFARQGGLVLDSEDVSFASLVNHRATLPEAQQQGLLRVKPGDPDDSFIIRKLRGQGPGQPMPQVGQSLPNPVIDMIADWIRRGALTAAEECKQSSGGSAAQQYCNDTPGETGNYVWQPLPALDPPAVGDGVQMHTPPRDVAPGTEWETCYAVHLDWPTIATQVGLPAGTLPTIREQVYRMHPGSHHLLLYAYVGAHPEQWAQGYFPCVAANCVDPGDCPSDLGLGGGGSRTALLLPVGGTQVAGTRYDVKYPDGVGIPVLSPQMVLIINEHYTNPFQPQQPIYGEAWLNLYFDKPGEYKATLDGIFGINYAGLLVEPFQSRTITKIWQPQSILTHASEDAAVFQLFGHMHKRGTEFRIDYLSGGHCSSNTNAACGRDADCRGTQTCVRAATAEDTTIYYTTAWDQAPIIDFPPPYFRVNRDQGLRWTCTHVNGVEGDPQRPPKRCTEGCDACGWTGGRCDTNGQLCNPASTCSSNETCVAETSGLSPSGYVCKNASGDWGNFCCPGSCTASADAHTCWFTRGVELGMEQAPRSFAEGDPMPLVFGQLADDDMCNMFGYFINQADLAKIGIQ